MLKIELTLRDGASLTINANTIEEAKVIVTGLSRGNNQLVTYLDQIVYVNAEHVMAARFVFDNKELGQ